MIVVVDKHAGYEPVTGKSTNAINLHSCSVPALLADTISVHTHVCMYRKQFSNVGEFVTWLVKACKCVLKSFATLTD